MAVGKCSSVMTYDYRFVTHWLVPQRADRVWELMAESLRAGDPVPWWGMVHTRSHDADSVWLRTDSGLGYRLNFRIYELREHAGHRLTFRADGDVAGIGNIAFTSMGPQCVVSIDWRVSLHKAWMRRWQWVLRPVFVSAHALVMIIGARRLKEWVRLKANQK